MWPCQAITPIARPPTPSATPVVTSSLSVKTSKQIEFDSGRHKVPFEV